MKNKIITGLLAMLGFSSCDPFGSPDMYGSPPAPEYGAPYADFVLKGGVTDDAGKPIEGIQVVLKPFVEHNHFNDTVKTDVAGKYIVSKDRGYMLTGTMSVIAEDIDGEENGEFKKQVQTFDMKQSDYAGSDGWYVGHAEKTVNFVLEHVAPEGNEKNNDDEK